MDLHNNHCWTDIWSHGHPVSEAIPWGEFNYRGMFRLVISIISRNRLGNGSIFRTLIVWKRIHYENLNIFEERRVRVGTPAITEDDSWGCACTVPQLFICLGNCSRKVWILPYPRTPRVITELMSSDLAQSVNTYLVLGTTMRTCL